MKKRFALYLIPDGTFYERGRSVVGYDIRNARPVQLLDFIDPSWVAACGVYGFHISITDAIEIDDSKLPEVIEKVEQLTQCFRPTNNYTLRVIRIGFWHPGSNMAVIELRPGRHIELLHDVLVSSLHPLGTGSRYHDSYVQNPASYKPDTPTDIARTKQFFSPYIFDNFVPHLTCIDSYDGAPEGRSALITDLHSIFAGARELTFDRISLVAQGTDEPHFRIVKEFNLNGR